MRKGKRWALVIWIAVLAGLSVLRVWLRMNSGVYLLADAMYDDAIQVRIGAWLAEGTWLGDYSSVTLIKGISFPVFVAVIHYFRLRYTFVYGVLILVCAGIFVLALSKKVRCPFLLGFFYLFLIYHPVGFSTSLSQRVYRNSITGWVLLVVLASLIGMWYSKKERIRKMIPWSVLCALSFPYFWYLREDSIWILPLMAVSSALVFGYVVWIRKVGAKRAAAYAALLVLPFVTLAGVRLGIVHMNETHYGIRAVNDRTETGFVETMALLYRIEDEENTDPDCWISEASVRKAMEVSSEFAKLAGPLFDHPENESSHDGDMWQWHIRAAADERGYYETASGADAYFTEVAAQLREAFENGTLKRRDGISLSKQARVFRPEEFAGYIGDTVENLKNLAEYRYCGIAWPLYSEGDAGNIEVMQHILKEKHPCAEEELDEYPLLAAVTECCNRVVRIYRSFSGVIVWSSLIGYAVLTVRMAADIRKKRYETFDTWIVVTGIALSLFLLTAMVTVFCSWMHNPEQDDFYLGGGHMMFAVLNLLMWAEWKDWIAECCHRWWEKSKKTKEMERRRV